MCKIFFTKKSEKDLNKLSSRDTKAALNKISKLKIPFPKNIDVKSITGVKNFYRLRTGKIRVIFEVDKKKKEIWIRKVAYRSSIYRF